MRKFVLVVSVLAEALLFGCNGSGSGTEGASGGGSENSTGSGRDAGSTALPGNPADALATALCQMHERCGNVPGWAERGGSRILPFVMMVDLPDVTPSELRAAIVANCITRVSALASYVLAADGVLWSAADFANCAQSLSDLNCTDRIPAACLPAPGSREAGSECELDAQCTSLACSCAGMCEETTNCFSSAGCDSTEYCNQDGECSPRLAEGADCTGNGGGCELNLVCSSTESVCAAPAGEGDECLIYYLNDCQPDLECHAEVCVRTAGLGEACDESAGPNCGMRLSCEANVCVLENAMPGETCSTTNDCFWREDNTWHLMWCGTSGTCELLPEAGDPCEEGDCIEGLECEGDCSGELECVDGTCTYPFNEFDLQDRRNSGTGCN